jgi:septum formation protein
MIELPKLVLASGSPRRSEILNSVGWPFEKYVADIDESERPGESPEDYVLRLAREKAEAVAANYPGQMVLGADTTVVVDGQILAKPVDMDDARRMICMLAGVSHDVLTGVAIVKGGTTTGLERTVVKFAPMTDAEVNFLAEMGDPLDKAGAYAIQKQAALFIEKIEGDYWNVVGLPVRLVYELVIGTNLLLPLPSGNGPRQTI